VKAKARVITQGKTKGKALCSAMPISFYGGVDPETGVVVEKGHDLEGKSVAGKILVFPTGKGSTVGSYVIYRLKKNGKAPLAIINKESDPVTAVGAVIAGIPMIDHVETKKIKTGYHVKIDGRSVEWRKN